jgi:hypothetical protein
MSPVRLAGEADDAKLRTLLQQHPMDSWVSITLEREPCYFKGASLMGESQTFISEEKHAVVGMFVCSDLPVYINGIRSVVSYLGGLRIHAPFRYKIRYLKEGFAVLKKYAKQPYWITSIASENTPARRLLEAKLKGMPLYTPIGTLKSLIFSTRRGKRHGLLQRASFTDIPQITAFYQKYNTGYQFAPDISSTWLADLDGSLGLSIEDFWYLRGDDGTIICSLALWDQRTFKQSVVQNYRTPLRELRLLYNLYAYGCKRVPLPACGKALSHLYIAFFASEETVDTLKVLEEAAYLSATLKSVTSCVLGLSASHPSIPRLKQKLKPSIYSSEIEHVMLADAKESLPLDGRPIQPEIALL